MNSQEKNGSENIHRLIKASDKIGNFFASMESHSSEIGVSKPELLALVTIYSEKEIIMRELAEKLEINSSTATGIIDRLVKKKMILRKRNQSDRRIVKVSISKQGKELVSLYQKQRDIIYTRMMDVLTVEEQEFFLNILEKIANNI